MKKNKENLFYSLLIVFIACCIIGYKLYLYKKEKKLNEYGIITVGKIIDVSTAGSVTTSGYRCDYMFIFNSIMYTDSQLSYVLYEENKYFEVRFLLNDPRINRMEFSKPIPESDLDNYFDGKCPF
jgi:hypothetical protein